MGTPSTPGEDREPAERSAGRAEDMEARGGPAGPGDACLGVGAVSAGRCPQASEDQFPGVKGAHQIGVGSEDVE